MIPLEFRRDFWLQRTRVPWLSYSDVCVILDFAVLVELRVVTDRQTHDDSIYCAIIASRVKNCCSYSVKFSEFAKKYYGPLHYHLSEFYIICEFQYLNQNSLINREKS